MIQVKLVLSFRLQSSEISRFMVVHFVLHSIKFSLTNVCLEKSVVYKVLVLSYIHPISICNWAVHSGRRMEQKRAECSSVGHTNLSMLTVLFARLRWVRSSFFVPACCLYLRPHLAAPPQCSYVLSSSGSVSTLLPHCSSAVYATHYDETIGMRKVSLYPGVSNMYPIWIWFIW